MSIKLRQICLVAKELQPVIDDLCDVFDLEVCFRDEAVSHFGLENALLAIGTNFIEVVAPTKPDTAAGRYLDRRGGNGGYMVITQADSVGTQLACRARAVDLGVRIAWERDHKTGHFMQLHPADVGGSFFEIDTVSNTDIEHFWPPAGGTGWQEKMKTHVVSNIVGAQLQTDDPRALAERWCHIAGVPLEKTDTGDPVLNFENGTLRFVEISDDRGPGLSGIDVKAANKDTILKKDMSRGLAHNDQQIIICGTRFNLV